MPSFVPSGTPVTVEHIGGESQNIRPGDSLRFRGATWVDANPKLWLYDVSDGRENAELVQYLGRFDRSLTWTAGPPGKYEIHTVGSVSELQWMAKTPANRTRFRQYEVQDAPAVDGADTSNWDNLDTGPEGPEPEDFAGVVNADNSDGAALAPALRRRGIEVDDVGTTATVGGSTVEIVDEGVVSVGGQTIEVGNITESDEVARVIDGPNAGDPVATDADVAPGSSSSGGSEGGVIGAVGVGIVLLLAGAAALLGGT